MSFIIYPQFDNSLAVIAPTGELTIEQVAAKDVPANTPYKIVKVLNIDNYFFNAYEYDDAVGAVVNIEKAKEIQRDKWRTARSALLQALDIEFQRAQETGRSVDLESVVQKKQALRDVTDTALPNDLEGIKNTWPIVLNS
jgi:hypothetical protein